MRNLSDTAKSLLTLLNNANELIVKSSDRRGAEDVMQAARAYAKGKNFLLPQDKISNFSAILIDARPYTLTMLIKDIAEDIIRLDTKKRN
jgi:hypothetical protein